MDPLLEHMEDKDVGSTVMMVIGNEFLELMKEEIEQGYALVLKPFVNPDSKVKEKDEVPKEV